MAELCIRSCSLDKQEQTWETNSVLTWLSKSSERICSWSLFATRAGQMCELYTWTSVTVCDEPGQLASWGELGPPGCRRHPERQGPASVATALTDCAPAHPKAVLGRVAWPKALRPVVFLEKCHQKVEGQWHREGQWHSAVTFSVAEFLSGFRHPSSTLLAILWDQSGRPPAWSWSISRGTPFRGGSVFVSTSLVFIQLNEQKQSSALFPLDTLTPLQSTSSKSTLCQYGKLSLSCVYFWYIFNLV